VNCAELGRKLRRLAVERDGGTAARLPANFNVAPGDPMIPAGADGLHRGFLSREARSVALDPVGFGFTVLSLGLGKNPLQKAITEAGDGCFDARYLRYVDTSADNHADSLMAGRPERNQNVIPDRLNRSAETRQTLLWQASTLLADP